MKWNNPDIKPNTDPIMLTQIYCFVDKTTIGGKTYYPEKEIVVSNI